MSEVRLCLVLPHVLLGGGETAMMELADGLRREVALDVCALDNAATGGAPTVREELVERFGPVTFVHERWQLRPRLAAADVVLWYGVVNSVPAALAALAACGSRPGSIRVVHTERRADGPGFARRWRRVLDAVVCVSPAVARRIAGRVFLPHPRPPPRLRGPPPGALRAAAGPRRARTPGVGGALGPAGTVAALI